jgi:fucose permease
VPESRRFHRDRLTWVIYILVAWFAYLQAAPGLVIAHLRTELHLNYSSGGLHVAAFALGSMVAGLTSARLERALRRGPLLWSGAACMGVGAVGLAAGQVIAVTVGSVLLIGIGAGTLLVTAQAALADHHRDLRAIALTEANVAASVAYVVLIGALSLAAATGAGWRTALIASLLVPALTWLGSRRLAIEAPPAPKGAEGRLPGLFWAAAVMILCTTAVEWCVTGWGATFVETATRASADVAVALMAGYFGGVLVGRIVGSRLARRIDPARLLGWAMVLTAIGFVILWPAGSPVQALLGLTVIGAGIGNLFPLGLAVAVGLAPGRAVAASGRAVLMASTAVLLAPLTVGALADALSLKAAFVVVPVMLALAAVGLAIVRLRVRRVAEVG